MRNEKIPPPLPPPLCDPRSERGEVVEPLPPVKSDQPVVEGREFLTRFSPPPSLNTGSKVEGVTLAGQVKLRNFLRILYQDRNTLSLA
jgi:hypothetical protein